MLFTIKDDLTLVKKLKLTPVQLMFVKMLYPNPALNEHDWRKQSYAMALEFQDMKLWTKSELDDLLEREIIIDLNSPGAALSYDCFEINPKYLRHFSLKVSGYTTELVDLYPHRIEADSLEFFAKDVSAEEIAEDYIKAINNSEETHNEVIDLLRWAIENNKLGTGLKKFVKSKYWLYLKSIRKEPKGFINGSLG